MNPNIELEEVISQTVMAWQGDDDGLGTEVYRRVRDWMSRNQIIFYQP